MTETPRNPPQNERAPENAGLNPVSDDIATELARRHTAAMDARLPAEFQNLLDRLAKAEEKSKKS